jgi:hypothetical protein
MFEYLNANRDRTLEERYPEFERLKLDSSAETFKFADQEFELTGRRKLNAIRFHQSKNRVTQYRQRLVGR